MRDRLSARALLHGNPAKAAPFRYIVRSIAGKGAVATMMTGFACEGGRLHRVPPGAEPEALSKVSWFDLEKPTAEETALVERITGLHVASREELDEIESSSRLGIDNGALYLSMPLVTQVDGDSPISSPLGFVVRSDRLITIRFAPSRLFEGFADRLPREQVLNLGPCHVFVGLLEAIVDRIADVLERIRGDLDVISS